jgi:hypothetical protein
MVRFSCLLIMKLHLVLGMVVIGISINPAKAVPLSTGDIKVNEDDLITLTYTYGFNHGNDKQGTWSYKFVRLPDPNLYSKPTLIPYNDGTANGIDPLDISNPDFDFQIVDELGHGSIATFSIAPLQWISQGQRMFQVVYDTVVIAKCGDPKDSCGFIDSQLLLNTKLNNSQAVNHIKATDEAYERVPVPGPLPLLGVGAAFGFSRKLRKRIKNSTLPEVISTIR